MYPVGQNVLIVDDDLGRGQAIERILREEGFAVTIATEGFAALRAAGSEQFALVIAAVELPGTLDGVTTVRRLRARQPWLKALFTGEFARGPMTATGTRQGLPLSLCSQRTASRSPIGSPAILLAAEVQRRACGSKASPP